MVKTSEGFFLVGYAESVIETPFSFYVSGDLATERSQGI
jgi:hypothetical protein